MATSGSKSVTVTSWDTLKFSWEEKSQDITNNKTTISWKMELIATSSGRIASTASKAWSVTVNGTKYSGTNTIGISNNATKTLASGTTTIAHNSDGTKTFSYSFSQEIAITFSGSYIGTKSGSGSGTLDTIPRKSTLSVGNGTLGTAQTLTVTRQSTSFTHTIVATCGDQSKTICTKSTSTSISFTPPLEWASENTTGTSLSVKYTITTYNGNTSLGSNSYTKTCSIPSSVKPSCSVAVTDPTGYADTYGGFIKGVSKFKVVVTPTTSYGSAIASYSTTANGSTYTASSFTTEVLKSSGTLTVKTTVKDKRGRSGSASVQKTVLDYSPPIIDKLVVGRCNADGTENDRGEYCKVVFSGSASSLNGKNSVTYRLYHRKSSETQAERIDFTEYGDVYSVEDVTHIFAADTGSSYVVTLHVIDNFNVEKPTARTTSVSTGYTLMHWLANGLGMGIGKVAELIGVLDIGFQTRFAGGILQPVLANNTDLDTVMTPNTYTANAATTSGYSNCPVTTATSFTLEVMSAGDAGQLLQRITTCTKGKPLIYERFYYSKSWGDWLCISSFGNKVLWSGGMYMTAGHTIALSEAISKQPTGIVLVFSEYVDDEAKNQSFHRFFVDKATVASHSGVGCVFQLSTSNLAYFATKYLYIHDETITGHDNNSKTITGDCGITATNNRFVLRYVIGV